MRLCRAVCCYPHVARPRPGVAGAPVKQVHIVVGVLSIVLMSGTGLLGAWLWWRLETTVWFWRLLRTAQVVVLLEAGLGAVYQLGGHKAPSIHIIYGVLPILVSFIGEQLRIASAQMILDGRGFESGQDVGRLPKDEQQRIVVTIVQREIGVMALAALVIVVLLARAAATA
jgi:hypothetical protein